MPMGQFDEGSSTAEASSSRVCQVHNWANYDTCPRWCIKQSRGLPNLHLFKQSTRQPRGFPYQQAFLRVESVSEEQQTKGFIDVLGYQPPLLVQEPFSNIFS